MPGLDVVIKDRWLEAQKCQHAKAYFAAVIIMGSMLEALLLSRALFNKAASYMQTLRPIKKREASSHS
jgi:hypothetical protein